MRVDVLVVGAGPAGAMAALALAPTRRVLVVDRGGVAPRVGESLIPAARRIFRDLGLLSSFELEGHAPWYGNVWDWGGVGETDFLRDPDGPGWHLDRARFDAWLLAEARARGAVVLRPASVRGVEREGEGWRVSVWVEGEEVEVTAGAIVDAGGRASAIGRMLGATREVEDRLVAGWRHGNGGGPGLSAVYAEPEGWWYTAPIPGGRVLAFHTDADLPAAADARDGERLVERARGVPGLREVVAGTEWGAGGFVAAHTAALVPVAGEGWVAVGDACLAFDPIASRGIFHALYTGLAGAAALEAGVGEYVEEMARVREGYRRERAGVYRAEGRWRGGGGGFWGRR